MARLLSSLLALATVDVAVLAGAWALAGTVAAPLATLPEGGFAAACYALGAVALPALGALLLARAPVAVAVGLGALLAAPLAAALRRSPRGSWRAARDLGVSRGLAVRAVLLPPLRPTLAGGLLVGIAALGLHAILRAGR